jgi:hypothetical protein
MFIFGAGVLMATRTDIANATPVNIGLVQEVAYDETKTLKPLFGQFQRPIAVGEGTIRSTGNAKVARISGLAMASVFYGATLAPGQTGTAIGEAGIVPSTPFQVTVANSATFGTDQGVIFAATGLPLKKVATGPTTGQYSVAAGVYTFAAADVGSAVLISYTYGITAVGQSFQIPNNLLGVGPTFSMVLYMGWNSAFCTLELYSCKSSKLGMGTKLEDWNIPQFDFEAFTNAAGISGKWSFPDTF